MTELNSRGVRKANVKLELKTGLDVPRLEAQDLVESLGDREFDEFYADYCTENWNEPTEIYQELKRRRSASDEEWPYCPNCGDKLLTPAGPYNEWTGCPNCGEVNVEFVKG